MKIQFISLINKTTSTIFIALMIGSLSIPSLTATGHKISPVAAEMIEAANNFLASLEASQGGIAGRTRFHFKDGERKNFHFFPILRRGVSWKEMNAAQRALAHALLTTGLSAKGYRKSLNIMSLGQVLRDLNPDSPNPYRDSDQYYVTIFGEPETENPWGWRIEGFHISVHFTVVDGESLASTPIFFGSHPAIVKDGPHKGLQVLKQEEDLGRNLVLSLTEAQREVAVLPLHKLEDTVGGLLTGNTHQLDPVEPRGLAAAEMTKDQKNNLMALIEEYALNRRPELAEQDLAKIENAGTDKIQFSWSGNTRPGEPHHYMIQGPTFLIELENTQDDANHLHCIWRDYEGDFGEDLIRKHINEHH